MTDELDRWQHLDALKVIVISSAQVIFFVAFYEGAVEIYVSNLGEMNKIFGFEMQVRMGLYLMSILACVNALAQQFVRKRIIRMVVPLICSVVWIAFWGNIAEVVPNRFLLLSVLGMISYFVGVLLAYQSGELRESRF